ncbi:P-loop containing nucleoside triphosphate hydrolases superfamily protein [Rhynchospora pubera]|uniref:P-loop containing nucleoside triphosphate hydrolases superfamily protein n=1 Tax=Rhynchospora pubera TaxID=906938 RepID=A0AAV8GB25_9POAL|nr:P-loop containing nucleoside triphosphate hydrolases superfamily protein [Rhynchospora pubera]
MCDNSEDHDYPKMTVLLEQLLSTDLDQSQLDALKSTILAVRYYKSSSMKLLWGPPGTGKTKTICSILWSLKRLKIRTLTCAPTNVAVVGVCSRLLHLLKSFWENCNSDGFPLCLADVVLFGSRGRMEIASALEDVFLDNRVCQLENFFSSLNGGSYGIHSMICLLEDCVTLYDVFEGSCKEHGEVLLGFGDYLRKQFLEHKQNLDGLFKTLFAHLPRRYLSFENCKRIVSLQFLLKELGGLLSSSDITEEQLKQTFETPPVSLCTTAQKKLIESRRECLEQLTNLQGMLKLSLQSLANCGSIREFCLQNATLVFCTASSSFLLYDAPTNGFDVVIIDEAAQLKECESVIPLRLNCVKHALLVGDECQLPALVKSQVSKRSGFGTSLFARLVSLKHEKHLLNTQYRMHPSISLFPNNRFYDGKVLDGSNVLEDGYNNKYSHFLFGSYAFVNINDGSEETDDFGKSWRNWMEVAVVVHLIKSLYDSWKRMGGKLSVGIVSPYTAQVITIKDRIGNKYDNDAGFLVRVNSIDGFQGQEEDVIILSTVRCNKRGTVGFLHDNQRTNVAITRARHCMWILGSSTTLLESGTIWSDIIFDARQRRCYFDAKDNEDLKKLILNVKNELDQLADLLNPNSVLFSATRWKVVFSDMFIKSFSKLKSKSARMGLIQLLLRLASGWRSKGKSVNMADRSFPARVYATAELYLVWSIDLQKDQQVYTQIIKLWDLMPLNKVDDLLKRLDYIFSMYTDAYMERCKTIYLEGMVEVPRMWIDGHEIAQYRKNTQLDIREDQDFSEINSSFLEDSKVNESLVLMRFYALSSGVVKHLLMAQDGSEIDVPFELNDQEMEIIMFPCSSFILGRSGTGKTTVLTTKLVRMEQQFFVASHGMGYSNVGSSEVVESSQSNEQIEDVKSCFLKQVFLTVSPKLCSAIRDQVTRLVRFSNFGELSGPLDSLTMHDDMDKLDEFVDIPDNFNDLTQNHYPLIITFRKFLMMLDGTMDFSFFSKFYAELGASTEEGVSKSRALLALIQSKEVHFDKFSGSYWPRFNEQLTKHLDASTVFTQIISYIKGGFGSIEGAIGREQYVSFSERRFSSLSRAVLERIYDIFLAYESKKLAAREFDLSDFVNNLHSRLNAGGDIGCAVDFIYVDEVQDLTVNQIALLKHVCKNFNEGYVFAGDTAQTIARGIDFRFEEIRSLFYKEFVSDLKGKKKESRLSDMFQLCQNFRSHIGILKLGQSIIDLLYYFFPNSVDKLNPETSLIYGDAPLLLESGSDENPIIKIFGGCKRSGGRPTEFGAEQVILVRDDSGKREVLEVVGKRALVLTILDCKGLEFQDVFLYNFFGSSPLENKWRVLYGYLENEDILDPSMTRSYPKFDISAHNLLCSELKQLYVAITRTRQRLWICENSEVFCKPMFDYWKKLCLVQGTELNSNFVEAMHTASSPADWRVRGIKLFNERQFEMATMCFEKAGDAYYEHWARAAGLVERAERSMLTNSGKAHTALQKAADIYETIQMFDKAATCYIKLGNYEKAGMIYLKRCGTSRLEEAGDCFEMIKCWLRAADAYFQAKCFSKCASACLKGELFDTGLKYLQKWQLEEQQNEGKFEGLEAIRDDYLMNCANYLKQRGDLKNMMHFVKSLNSLDKIRKFLNSKDLLDELLTLELEADNFVEAAKIAQSKGDLLLEASVWEKAGSLVKASKLVISDVITKSLWSYGRKGWPPKSFPKSEVHFTKAKGLAKKVSFPFYNSICSELQLWDDKPKKVSMLIKLLVEAEKSQDIRLAFLSLRCLLDFHLAHQNSKYLYLLEEEALLDFRKKFHEMLVQGVVSLNTLVHIWVQWREYAMMVSSSLCEEFCHDYLGVRREENSDMYFILNPHACWCRDRASKKSSGEQYLMSNEEYILSASGYWKNEIFCVGKAVVEKLYSLLRSSHRQMLSPETKGKISLLVFEVIKSLKQASGSKQNWNYHSYMDLIEEWFWDAIFLLDSKSRATPGILSVVDCPAGTELVEESLRRILTCRNGKFTYGQIGRLSTIFLLNGKLPDNLFEKIKKSAENLPQWVELFASLEVFFVDGSERISMVMKFQKALQATYEANWMRELDYMPPHCYLYLLNLLTFFASSCLGSVGYMITTRSVLAEVVKLRGCETFLDSPLDQMLPEAGTLTSLRSSFEFIVKSIEALLGNKSEMFEWIDKCSPSMRNFYSLMVLRLAITLCLAYCNMSLDICSPGKFLSRRHDISYNLPVEFSSKLQQAARSRDWNRSFISFVDAFASIGDHLVVISAKRDGLVFPPSRFFFFFCEEIRDRDHIMKVLFPKLARTDVPSSTVPVEATIGRTEDQSNKKERPLLNVIEEFQRCEKRDTAGVVHILGVLLLWLKQNKPHNGFYGQLLEETRRVYDHFEKITTLPQEKHSYPSLEDLYSYWQDGATKLNLIIDTLVSEKLTEPTVSALEAKKIVTSTPVLKEEVKEREQDMDTCKEPLWDKIAAFQQGSYQKEDAKSNIVDLLSTVLTLFDESESVRNFDEHLVDEMQNIYNSFSDLLDIGEAPTLDDLYSEWPHGEIKLKLIIDTILAAHKDTKSDCKEASGSGPAAASKMVEEKAVKKTDEGPSSKHKKKKSAKRKSKKGNKKG